jgi:fibronectin type 3 domain-containing protein
MLNRFYLLLYITLVIALSGCRRDIYTNNTVTGLPPAVPVGLKVVSAYDGAVLIAWQNNMEADFSGYNVFRSINNSSFLFLTFTSNNYYFDDSLNYQLNYYYKVNAVNNAQMESLFSDSVLAQPVNLYPPAAPANLSFTISARNWEGQRSVVLTWNPNSEGDVAWYYVYKSTMDNFTADSNTFIGKSHTPNYTDTINLALYTNYYYKLRAVDKGNLQSNESRIVHDMIFDIPAVLFPPNGTQTAFFSQFAIKTLSVPANYKIVVQTNQFFDEFWSTVVSSSILNDTLNIDFTPPFLNANTTYYWRVSTYSQNSSDPNSISQLYQFTIKP